MTESIPIMPAPGERWEHCQGGVYEIVGFAHEEATGNLLVLYKPEPAQHQEHLGSVVRTCPLGEFLGSVGEVSLGLRLIMRFRRLEDPEAQPSADEEAPRYRPDRRAGYGVMSQPPATYHATSDVVAEPVAACNHGLKLRGDSLIAVADVGKLWRCDRPGCRSAWKLSDEE